MAGNQLGRMVQINLREIWNDEAADFTPWLAQEENLKLLGNIIALDLELVEVERWVGPFRADIVCKDTVTNTWVLIENQLERTDHGHLGQLITYAAGLDAVTIVWVADRFRDEHRAALDWLNKMTDVRINFFGLEIELWQIGESPPAPKFNMVSEPNDWTRTAANLGKLSPTQQMQLEYWTALREFIEDRGSVLNPQKPSSQNWTSFAIGRSGFSLDAGMNTRENRLNVQLTINYPTKTYFHLLLRDGEVIENDLGFAVDWREMPERKTSALTVYRAFNVDDRDQWLEQHTWLCDTLEAFHRVLAPRIKSLDMADYDPDDAE